MPLKPTVLIVENESLIRMYASDIASEAGYPVIEVSSAGEALASIRSDASIGIVFTDIHMPGSMDGLEMSHIARDLSPPLRFLVVSGHRKVEPDQLPAESRFFSKPYDVEEITDALDRLAEERREIASV